MKKAPRLQIRISHILTWLRPPALTKVLSGVFDYDGTLLRWCTKGPKYPIQFLHVTPPPRNEIQSSLTRYLVFKAAKRSKGVLTALAMHVVLAMGFKLIHVHVCLHASKWLGSRAKDQQAPGANSDEATFVCTRYPSNR